MTFSRTFYVRTAQSCRVARRAVARRRKFNVTRAADPTEQWKSFSSEITSTADFVECDYTCVLYTHTYTRIYKYSKDNNVRVDCIARRRSSIYAFESNARLRTVKECVWCTLSSTGFATGARASAFCVRFLTRRGRDAFYCEYKTRRRGCLCGVCRSLIRNYYCRVAPNTNEKKKKTRIHHTSSTVNVNLM